jgi:glutamate dehydrogenase/leucine dehydrogenase
MSKPKVVNFSNESSDHYLESFMELVKKNNPNEPEFHQAVYEVALTIVPYIFDKKEIRHAKILERLVEPDRTIIFRVCWTDDAGNVQVNRGYRVQHCNAIGPYKGGLRFHPSVSLSVLKFLAFEQTFKNSLTGLPLGGGKGGSDFDPKGKSDAEVMRFCQSFMTELTKHIGPYTDVPAGDIGVGAREVGYLFGQNKRISDQFNGILTGKGLTYGGSLIRTEATGYGAVYMLEQMLKEKGQKIEGKIACVSGSGNVAEYAVEKLIELGAKVVTLSDSDGFIYDAKGITREKLDYVRELKQVRRGRISEYAKEFNAQYFEGERPWGIKCDVALPCATQNELDENDAKKLIANGCVAVAEGANMPTTQKATDEFIDAKILFAPGKAANAGGVAVSGLEMTQNSMRMGWTREDLDKRLQDIMLNIHTQCVQNGREKDGYVNYVKGANIAGFKKVCEALIAQGVY